MNPFQKLLQSISGSGIQRAAGLIDNLGTPIRKSLEDMPANLSILRDLVTRGRPTSVVDNLGAPIEKVVRKIDDVVIRGRPASKVAQSIINENFPGDFSSYIRHGSTPGIYDQSGFKYISTLNPTQKFLQEYGNKLSSGVDNLGAPIQRSIQSVAESLLPKQTFNPVGGVGGLIQNLNKAASPLFQSSTSVKNIPGIGSLPGFARNMLVPASPAGVAFAVAGLEGSSPQGFDNWRQLGYRSKEDMQNKVRFRLDTQTTKEGTLDTGRYIPGDQQKTIFTKQFDPAPPVTTPPVNSGSTQAGTLNTGVGTPDQRRVIEERNYQTQLSNAKQQYATPDPMSPDFQGYPNELAAQYGLEQAYGQELKQAGTLVPQLQEAGAGAGMTAENFAAWAKANPGLAVRLLSQGQRN